VARVGANAGLLTKAKGVFGVTDNTLVVSLNPSTNIDFLFHYLGNININRLIFGSGQPLITGSILKTLPILVPADSEQRRISACLSSLDEMIIAQGCKLEAIKTHKKGLMQQLFPSSEEVEA
jgi:type I restriction enzyme S subunit